MTSAARQCSTIFEVENAGPIHQCRALVCGGNNPIKAQRRSYMPFCSHISSKSSGKGSPALLHPQRKQLKLVCSSATSAAPQAESAADAGVGEAVSLLKQAAASRSVPAVQVFQALLSLEKKKLPGENLGSTLGGAPGGKGWRLTFVSGAKQVTDGQKGGKGGGYYVPISAVQRWDAEKNEIRNGIYLGQIAAMEFEGPYELKGKKLSFDFKQLKVRLGPKWFPFKIPSSVSEDGKKGPFFLFFYADEEICLARGKGGGFAMWTRTTPSWELKAGVSL